MMSKNGKGDMKERPHAMAVPMASNGIKAAMSDETSGENASDNRGAARVSANGADRGSPMKGMSLPKMSGLNMKDAVGHLERQHASKHHMVRKHKHQDK